MTGHYFWIVLYLSDFKENKYCKETNMFKLASNFAEEALNIKRKG